MNRKIWILLILIIVISLVLRIYKLDQVPPSINWDEAANGYNAWTIANYGRDEWGKSYPLYFASFRDNKHPIHIYITSIFVKAFGLSDFTVRLPSAIFGTLNVFLIFFLTKILFKDNSFALIAASLLAISPYSIQFSRYNHEANFALFFFILGLVLFFLGIEKKNISLSFAFLSFGLCLLSYHSSMVVVPMTILILLSFYVKKIIKLKKFLLLGVLFFLLFVSMLFLNRPLLGFARIKQTSIQEEQIKKTWSYKEYKSKLLGFVEVVFNQYSSHFEPQFLFLSGDKNSRHSSQYVGEFYMIDSLFLVLGIIFLILRMFRGNNDFGDRVKIPLLIILLALIAPLPSTFVRDAPHAGRSLFMMGIWHIILAYGIFKVFEIFKNQKFKSAILFGVIFLTYTFSLKHYLTLYFQEYSKSYAIDWQYGMKEIVYYVKDHPEYSQVYMTDTQAQPYIFFLFYLKTPLPDLLNNVYYADTDESRTYNTISSFGRYHFGGWEPTKSVPSSGVLYILTAAQYDGLEQKSSFNIEKIINYPNGRMAFVLMNSKNNISL